MMGCSILMMLMASLSYDSGQALVLLSLIAALAAAERMGGTMRTGAVQR